VVPEVPADLTGIAAAEEIGAAEAALTAN